MERVQGDRHKQYRQLHLGHFYKEVDRLVDENYRNGRGPYEGPISLKAKEFATQRVHQKLRTTRS